MLPHANDAWVVPGNVKIGYEINFNRYFYKPVCLRSLTEIGNEIKSLEREAEGILTEIVGAGV